MKVINIAIFAATFVLMVTHVAANANQKNQDKNIKIEVLSKKPLQTKITKYRYAVYVESQKSKVVECTGVLISANTVLVTADCVNS